MANGPLEQHVPSSEPSTVARPERKDSVGQANSEPVTSSNGLPPSSFADIEGPTLSSPSQSSDSKLSTIAGLESRIETLEKRLSSNEQAMAEVYGAVEHLVTSHETLERAVRQQRYSRYLVWGTLLLILGVLWATLQARLGHVLPR